MTIEDRSSPLTEEAQSTIGCPPAGEPMLIDRLMPCYDADRAEHRIVPGDIVTVYAATRRADFIRAWRESAAVRLLFAARGLGERAISVGRSARAARATATGVDAIRRHANSR